MLSSVIANIKELKREVKLNSFWYYKVKFILSNISESADVRDRLGGL